MIRNNPNTWGPLRTGSDSRAVALIRQMQTVRQSLTPKQFWWTLGLGLIGGMLFLISHSMLKLMSLVSHPEALGVTLLESAFALGMSVVVAFLLLLAVSIATSGEREQSRAWLRYVIATVAAVSVSTAIVHLLAPYIPVGGIIGWYWLGSQTAIDSFVFSNWILFGGLAVFVYVRLERVRRDEAAFERVELERAAVGRQVLMSQLAAMQAQVEPTLLFNTLSQVESLYERDATRANRILDDLILYLRDALPRLRDDRSTLAREARLAESYLRIVQARMGSRLEFACEIPAELRTRPFPPMLLLPLIDNAVRHGLEPVPCGGRIDVCATLNADRLRLAVSDSGLGEATMLRERHGLTALRRRLAGLYGESATLNLSATQPHGVTATIEVPGK